MGLNHVMWLLKSWTHALKTCDEDIASFFFFSFSTIANLYMLPRPMLFPIAPMISISTKKIKKYTLFCYFKSEARSWFQFPQTKIKIYFIIITLIIIIILILIIIIIIYHYYFFTSNQKQVYVFGFHKQK